MNEHSFATTFTVDRSPDHVFAAINNVRGWWTGEIVGDAGELGGQFSYRYEDIHRSTQHVIELVPGKRVVWRVTSAELSFASDKAEWTGTEIVFDIVENAGRTELHFRHDGLVPRFECFDQCSRGWTYYIDTSLRNFIEVC